MNKPRTIAADIAALTAWLRQHADRAPGLAGMIEALPSLTQEQLDAVAALATTINSFENLTDVEREELDDVLGRAADAATSPSAASMPLTDPLDYLAVVGDWLANPTAATVERAVTEARKPKH